MLALSKSISNGGPEIVHEDWVSSCIAKCDVVDENDFRPTSIPKSAMQKREVAVENAFHGYAVHVTKNVKPPPKELKQIIEAGGGVCCTPAQMSRRGKGLKIIAITCDADVVSLSKDAAIFVDGIFTNEFVLGGLIQQEFDVSRKNRVRGLTTSSSSSSSSSPAAATKKTSKTKATKATKATKKPTKATKATKKTTKKTTVVTKKRKSEPAPASTRSSKRNRK